MLFVYCQRSTFSEPPFLSGLKPLLAELKQLDPSTDEPTVYGRVSWRVSAMSDWGGSSNTSYAQYLLNRAPDSDDEVWEERSRQRIQDRVKRTHFGVIRQLSDHYDLENYDFPQPPLPRAVVQHLLADPAHHLMSYDEDFLEDLISAAWGYGIPLYFNSWNRGGREEEG